MKALVTGGAGYIGSVVAATLLDEGHSVSVVDDLSSGHRDSVPDGATFHELSVGDAAGVSKVLDGASFDVCLHFAGLILAGESMVTPEPFFTNNVGETFTLLRELVEHDVGKFVFSSSATVYGEPLYTPIDEEHRTQTVNPYGESKLIVEQALGWLSRLGRLRFAALRYFNAAGAVGGRPERHQPESHLIPLALAAAAGDGPALQLYGDDYATPDGTCIRDYIHIGDLATAHVLAIDALDDEDAFICNLGSATGSSNAEVIRAVQEITGLEVPVHVAARRPGDVAILVAANDKARNVLGWSLGRSTLDQIVTDAWAAYRAGASARP